jgi:hypothetical protein
MRRRHLKCPPGHEERVHPIDFGHDGVDDGLAVDRTGIELQQSLQNLF